MLNVYTQLQLAIDYVFESNNILEAICTHKSVLSKKEALIKFGYFQSDMALLGDSLLRTIVMEILLEQQFTGNVSVVAHKLLTNISLSYTAKRLGIDSALSSKEINREHYIHSLGTLIEGIAWGIHLESGYSRAKKFVVEKIMPFAWDFYTIAQKNENVMPTDVTNYQELTELIHLKSLIYDFFENKLAIITTKEKLPNNFKEYTLRLEFYIINSEGDQILLRYKKIGYNLIQMTRECVVEINEDLHKHRPDLFCMNLENLQLV